MNEIERQHYINEAATSEDAEIEETNFISILAAFKHYREYSISRVNKTEKYLNTIPTTHQKILVKYREHLSKIRKCIDENHQFIRKLVENTDQLFVNGDWSQPIENGSNSKSNTEKVNKPIELFKILKVQITLKQFARDWSAEGAEERKQCYKPIIDEVISHYDPDKMNVSDVKVLVPGAGLGRLAYEFAHRGFRCEGNEFSLFMLIASNFVLNKCIMENQYTIYPWVHQYVNNLRREDQIRSISFPDVSPIQAPPRGEFSMIAGDFLTVYDKPGFYNYWDCIAASFFIDCANNVAAFIELIFKILKPGGIWVNMGPLLYHYSDVENEDSIEPTYEDIILIIQAFGFEILKNETGIRTKYAQNLRSMYQGEYESIFIVCRKPLKVDADELVGQNGGNGENGS